MFNYAAINKTPTINQIKAIIEYMEKDPNLTYNFSNMMDMERVKINEIYLDLNNGHRGTTYIVVFNDEK